MASISRDANGSKRLTFMGLDGNRVFIRLGHVPVRDAEHIKVKVEHLLAAKKSGLAVPADVASWVATITDDLAERLASVGLILRRMDVSSERLGAFLQGFIDIRTDVKPQTRIHFDQARKNLVAFFGTDKPIRDVTAGDADEFRLHLMQRLADNTVRRLCGRAKQFFRFAVRKKLIAENPFGDLQGCTVRANAERMHFIPTDVAQRILDACPNAEWRLIFALARWGGLRVPSELMPLRWVDVDWERNRLRITSPKTEHHEGKGSRVIPLFPELRPHLEAAFDAAAEGSEFVITTYRDSNANLRTQLQRIMRKASVEPWPKLFQNLRATRETELAQHFPVHIACAWIGNTAPIAAKHYLQVTESDFTKATCGDAKWHTAGTLPTQPLAQNRAQQLTEVGGNRSQPPETTQASELRNSPACIDLRQIANVCVSRRDEDVPPSMPRTGLEAVHETPVNSSVSSDLPPQAGTKSCTLLSATGVAPSPVIDQDLQRLIDAWPHLRHNIKSAILSVIDLHADR